MRLFRKQAQPENVDTGYQDCVDYLCALEQPDYAKILKVVNTYREADKKVKKILGVKENSVTDSATADQLAEDFLSDDDLSLGGFLDDELPPKPKAKAKKQSKK